MPECFCGCGERIGFADRGLNKQGRRTDDLLTQLRDCRQQWQVEGPLTDDGEIEPLLASLDEEIAQGEFFRGLWVGWVHGDEPMPPTAEARLIKRQFTEWGKKNMQLVRIASAPRDQLLQALRNSEP